ncbi:MAG TPA: integrase core domain-containing protein [Candidatus Dormibacteraeota bacterium]|nr:integrase core domain-containing protein [Candidatus Dormibacteraeota bacterium]
MTDNAAVFSGTPRKGRVVLESELDRLGIETKHSTPYHPQTCSKVERFHQTLRRYLQRQAAPQNLAHLQLQLDSFRLYYNSSDRIDLSTDALHSKPSRPGSRHALLCQPHPSNTESVATGSTAKAGSPSDTSIDCATSTSATNSSGVRSRSWLPDLT